MLDGPCSRQPENMPSSPCLGFLPPLPPPLGGVLLSGALFKYKPTNPESTDPIAPHPPPHPPPIRLSHPGQVCTCPNHSKQLETTPVPQPILSLLILPHPFLPVETTIIKVLAHNSPSLYLMTNPGGSLCGHHGIVCPLLLGTVSNKISFQKQLFLDLLAYTSNFLWIHYISEYIPM